MKNTMTAAQNRVPAGMKLGYGLGDFGANMVYQSVMLYLMFYFTDVFLIGASAAGTIFLVAKFWDAVTDPLIGFASDATKSRWGRKRPYLLFGAVPLGASMYLLFASPAIPESWKVIYGLAAFLLVCTAYTVVNIPYGALTASLTTDSHERSRVTGYRMFFAILGTLVVAGATKPLAGLFSSPVQGWRFVGLVYGIIAALFTLITFFSVRERIQTGTEKFSPGDIRKVVLANRPFIVLSLGMVMHLGAIGILAAMVNYHFKYNFHRESFVPLVFLCLFATAAVSIPLWVYLSKKIGKKNAFNTGMLIVALSLIVLFFVKDFNMGLFIPLFIVTGIGISTMFFSPWAMIPDTVEYSEWKTGLRREGILYGFFYFSHKLAAALAGFITGLGLSAIGYLQPLEINTVITAQEQGESTLYGIRLLATLVPVALIMGGIFFISRYPIDEKMHAGILEDLRRK